MMTASTPRRSVSLCQSHTGSAPAKVETACQVSWSVLMPGNTQMPMRAGRWPLALTVGVWCGGRGRETRRSGSRFVDGEGVVLDDGVGEQLAAHLVDLGARFV